MTATWVSNRSWDFHGLLTTSKTHGIARHMTSQKFLLFRVTNWNDRPTRCSTPPIQIVPNRIFYYLEFVSSKNLLWPEINRTMQSFFYLTLYTTSTPYTLFLDRYQNSVTSIVVWFHVHWICVKGKRYNSGGNCVKTSFDPSEKGSTLKGTFESIPFSEEVWCAEKLTGSYKIYLP